MKLIEKIQSIRVVLQDEKIKMTGENTFANYKYFELDDFLKPLNKLMLENKMTAIPSFNKDEACLTAYDFESEEMFVLSSPMGTASLKGCHEVQNIGAVETYQRRYLYQAMFDIAESDALNKTQFKPETKKPEVKEKVRTNKQILIDIAKTNPVEAEHIKDILIKDFEGKKGKDLTEEESIQILKQIENEEFKGESNHE